MSLQVLVSFPGTMTLGDFSKRLNLLTEMGCTLHLGQRLVEVIDNKPVSKSFKAKAGKDFNDLFEETEELTPEETALLDKGLKLVHDAGSSPLMDSMTRAKVGRLKPNMTAEIVEYFRENPGHNKNTAASILAEKFVAHYKDINDAFRRIRSNITTATSGSLSQRKLENRGGRGDMAQLYLI